MKVTCKEEREGGFIYRAFLIVSIASLTFLSPSPLMI